MNFSVSELSRRLNNMVRVGTISAADYAGEIPKCRVKIGDIETDYLPMTTLRAGGDRDWCPLEVGEQVVVMSPMGDYAQGIIMSAINQTAASANGDNANVRRTTYKDGAVIEYDRENHHLTATLPDGATTTLISKGGIAIEGDVTVTGHITATGDISDHTRSMQGDRDIYNGHTHSDPQGGRVEAPEQQQ